MFSTLRQDSLLYVIDKNSQRRFYTVRNPKVSAPYPEFKTAFPTPGTPMFVDVDGEDGNTAVKFAKLPAAMSAHEFNGIFVTENRDAVQAELEAMKAKSKSVLDSREYHEEIIAFCDETLPLVNPNIAQERDRENRLESLEGRMGNIETLLSELNGTIKNLKPQQQ